MAREHFIIFTICFKYLFSLNLKKPYCPIPKYRKTIRYQRGWKKLVVKQIYTFEIFFVKVNMKHI